MRISEQVDSDDATTATGPIVAGPEGDGRENERPQTPTEEERDEKHGTVVAGTRAHDLEAQGEVAETG